MDLRDLIRTQPELIVGHVAVKESLNVQKELKRFAKDPLEPLIQQMCGESSELLKDDIGRYIESYSWYLMCLKRCFEHMSISRRWYAEVKYHPKNKKFSERQCLISEKYWGATPYMMLDYQNLIVHACMLLDRSVTLTRHFLSGGSLPSFTSFNKHMNFLERNPSALAAEHKPYRSIVLSCKSWFHIPLRVLRDKYLMHSAEKHMAFLGWGKSDWDMELVTMIPRNLRQEKPLQDMKVISFTPRRLARDIEAFFSGYEGHFRGAA